MSQTTELDERLLELELDHAAAKKADRGEPLTAEEAARVEAFKRRALACVRAMVEGLKEYTQAGITADNGYPAGVVIEAELAELERRRRRPSRVPLTRAVIRRLSASTSTTSRAGGAERSRDGRPRRSRSRSPGGGSDDGGGSDPPLITPAGRLTAAGRKVIREQRDADARARVKRERRLGLPDGVDRERFCSNGHRRDVYERTVVYPSGLKKECRACKAERDAARSHSSRPSLWLPVLTMYRNRGGERLDPDSLVGSRLAAAVGLVAIDDSHGGLA